jgi:hypothetical protein
LVEDGREGQEEREEEPQPCVGHLDGEHAETDRDGVEGEEIASAARAGHG